MRAVHLVRLDKVRPAVLLTRADAVPWRERVTVAPITSTDRSFAWEVRVGPENGLDRRSVINCDDVTTVAKRDVGAQLGYLTSSQEQQLAEAIAAAFDLDLEEPAF